MKKKLILCIIGCWFSSAFQLAFAHGLMIDFVLDPPVVIVNAYFAKGSPVKNAGITIMAPDTEQPFQTGNTDLFGNFVFMPDKQGKWTVIVDDGIGHKRKREIEISENFFSEHNNTLIEDEHQHQHDFTMPENHEHSHEHAEIPLLYKILFGLSLIFGLTGIIYGYLKHKKS